MYHDRAELQRPKPMLAGVAIERVGSYSHGICIDSASARPIRTISLLIGEPETTYAWANLPTPG